MRVLLVSSLVLGVGCGGVGKSVSGPTAPDAPAPASPHGAAAEREIDIGKAALPYYVLDRRGHQIDDAAFVAALDQAPAVCIGEQHTNPHHHWLQLQLLTALSDRASGAPGDLALGLEMVQRPFQAVLDDYASGKIDEADMLSRVGWHERWGHSFALYRPLLALAAARGHAILALNASDELRDRFRASGADGLTAADRARLPELVLDDEDHRAWFDGIMVGHPSESEGGPRADEVYAMQVLWDETMADTAATWLAEAPGRKVVVLAGNGHCHDSAVVGRIARRGQRRAVSVRPVFDGDDGEVASALAEGLNDYIVVLTLPEAVTRN